MFLKESLKRANEHELKTAILPTLADIDTPEDWEKHGWF